MVSNVCKIEKGRKDLPAILKESEKVAAYNELNQKQTLQLRLLCEELDGMLPELVGDFEGKLWIELENGLCKINVSIMIDAINSERRKELIGIAKSNKNSSSTGFTGKIRSALENVFLDDDVAEGFAMSTIGMDVSTGYYSGMDYSSCWSLKQYKASVNNNSRNSSWDELEKSVVATIADDIVVGVKGRRADIIIVKKFA